MESLPQKYSNGSWLLRGLLNEALGDKNQAKQDFTNSINSDEPSKNFIEKNKELTLEVFPLMNRLCINFPLVELSFKNHPKLVNTLYNL